MKHAAPDPDQVTDPIVVEWFREVDRGSRTPEVTTIPVAWIRSNPYVFRYEEATLQAMVDELVNQGPHADQLAWVIVARLPHGGFVDVDTPYPCEAVKRVGQEHVKATIVGSFTEADCERIGIPTAYPADGPDGTSQATAGSPWQAANDAVEAGPSGRIVFPDGYPPREESAILEELAAELAAGRPVSVSELANPDSDPYPALVSKLAEAISSGRYAIPGPILFGDTGCGRSTLYLMAACAEAGIDHASSMSFDNEPPGGEVWERVLDTLEPGRWRSIYEIVDSVVTEPAEALVLRREHKNGGSEPEIEGGIGGASFGTIRSDPVKGAPSVHITVGAWWENALVFYLSREPAVEGSDEMFLVVTHDRAHEAVVLRDTLDALIETGQSGTGAAGSYIQHDCLNYDDKWLELRAGVGIVDIIGTDGAQEFHASLTLDDAIRLGALIDEASEALGW